MKKVLGIMAVVALSALMFTSCGKKCTCTRYEDGKKVAIETRDLGTKYLSKDACAAYSRPEHNDYTLASENATGIGLVECKVKYVCK